MRNGIISKLICRQTIGRPHLIARFRKSIQHTKEIAICKQGKASCRATKRSVVFISAIAIISVIVGIFLFSGFNDRNNTSTDLKSIPTMKVEKRTLLNSINVSGRISGRNTFSINSDLDSKITKINVHLGDRVTKGDVLCVFDSTEYQKEYDILVKAMNTVKEQTKHNHEVNQRALENAKQEKKETLAQAQRAVDQANDSRDSAYSRYDTLKSDYSKCVELRDSAYKSLADAIDESDYDTKYNDYNDYSQKAQSIKIEMDTLGEQLTTYDYAVQTAKDAYTNAERTANYAIQQAQDVIDSEKYVDTSETQIEIDSLSEKISACKVIAPETGVITSLNISEGSIPASQQIITIEDDSVLIINVIIKESDILFLSESMDCIVKTPATGTKEYHGSVVRVEKILSPSEEGYRAEIEINDKDANLYLGMNAKVQIILEKKDNVIAVPYDSIIKDDNDKSYIYTVSSSDGVVYTVKKNEVMVGLESDYYIEIISDEINDSSIIVTTPLLVNNGDVVLPIDVNGSTYE